MNNVNSNHRFSLLICAKRISQLVYLKLKDIEQALIIAKNNLEIDNLNDSDLSETSNYEEEETKFQNLKLELVNLERQTLRSKIVIKSK